MNSTLKIWNRLGTSSLGKWLFSRVICLKAPYFSTISPNIVALAPGYSEVRISNSKKVHNHLGTVHAIAMCNMAELAGGLMTDVTIASTQRWIPVGMTVRYLKKAKSDLLAKARPLDDSGFSREGECKVLVEVQDEAGQLVFDAIISMMVSSKPA